MNTKISDRDAFVVAFKLEFDAARFLASASFERGLCFVPAHKDWFDRGEFGLCSIDAQAFENEAKSFIGREFLLAGAVDEGGLDAVGVRGSLY